MKDALATDEPDIRLLWKWNSTGFLKFIYWHAGWLPAVFHNRIQLNPDPAKNLNPDLDPEDLERIQAIS